MTCSKCGSAMEPGYQNDIAHGVVMQASWSPGPPERRRYLGGIKWKRKESIDVATYRCVGCGFLESYAKGET